MHSGINGTEMQELLMFLKSGKGSHRLLPLVGIKKWQRFPSRGSLPYQKWLAGEVVPAIRKHGMYAPPRTIEAMLANLSGFLTGSALSAHHGPACCARNKFFPCKPKKGYPD